MNAGSEAVSNAARPALVARAQVTWPVETPMAVNTPLLRPPSSVLRMVNAVSGPGVTMTSAETAVKAARSTISNRPPTVARERQRIIAIVIHGADVLRYTAFSLDTSGGNPAGVVLDAGELTDSTMLAIAAEVGYSETAFVW